MKRNISSFLEKGTKKKVKIILFAPYISKSGLNIIKDIFNDNNLLGTCEFIIGNHIIIKPLIDYLTENEILILQSKFSEFDNLASKRYAIYFDHKLPDYLSGFPEFYSGKVDRRIFYPLFKYCNKYNYNINIYNGKSIYEPNNANGCPFSPYKKNYIKNLSDNNLLLEKFYYLKEEPIKKEEISTTKKKLKLQKQSELEEKRFELQEKIQELKIQINLLKNLLEDYNKKNK